MTRRDRSDMSVVGSFTQSRFWLASVPAPGVPEPNRREQMERRRFRAAVFRAHANQNVMRVRLGVLELDIEIAVLSEGVRVPNFKFAFHFRTGTALRDQLFVGKTRLRLAVIHPHETV